MWEKVPSARVKAWGYNISTQKRIKIIKEGSERPKVKRWGSE